MNYFTESDEKLTEVCSFFINCLEPSVLDDHAADVIFNLVFDLLSEVDDTKKIPDSFYKYVRVLVLRLAFSLFPNY